MIPKMFSWGLLLPLLFGLVACSKDKEDTYAPLQIQGLEQEFVGTIWVQEIPAERLPLLGQPKSPWYLFPNDQELTEELPAVQLRVLKFVDEQTCLVYELDTPIGVPTRNVSSGQLACWMYSPVGITLGDTDREARLGFALTAQRDTLHLASYQGLVPLREDDWDLPFVRATKGNGLLRDYLNVVAP